jgi:hypothetical protein
MHPNNTASPADLPPFDAEAVAARTDAARVVVRGHGGVRYEAGNSHVSGCDGPSIAAAIQSGRIHPRALFVDLTALDEFSAELSRFAITGPMMSPHVAPGHLHTCATRTPEPAEPGDYYERGSFNYVSAEEYVTEAQRIGARIALAADYVEQERTRWAQNRARYESSALEFDPPAEAWNFDAAVARHREHRAHR